MKINRSFAPLTILIETEEDLLFISKVVDLALAQHMKSRISNFYGSHSLERDTFYHKLELLRVRMDT